MSKWVEYSLEQVAAPGKNSMSTGPFGSAISSRFFQRSGVPVIRGSNLSMNVSIRLIEDGLAFISPEKAREFNRSQVVRGDLIFTCWGTIGQIGLIDSRSTHERYIVSNKQMKLTPNREIADPLFLYYRLSAPDAITAVQNASIGSSVPGFNLTQLRKIRVTIPSPREQETVVALLGALDDKIAASDRIATTSLELTSEILAKMLTEDLYVADIALGDVAAVNQRKVKPTPGRFLRYIDISSVSVDRFDWPIRIPWGDAPGRARRGVTPGDTIWSTVRPERRSRTLILDDDPELVVSTGFAVLTPQEVGPAFLYEVTRRNEFVRYLESVAEGSAYPAVRAERFKKAPIPLLSPHHMAKFEAIAIELHRRVHAARKEARTLAKMLDILLPRLMSGEIRVREAEKVVEEVT